MKYDFDTEIDRKGTSSAKWELIQEEQDPLKWQFTDRCFGANRTLPMCSYSQSTWLSTCRCS